MSKQFKLSASLYGHSMDVRALAITESNDIISASRDRTTKYWKYNPLQNVYQDVMTYKGHENFVGSVLYLEPTKEYPDGLVITGGYDKNILIYKPGEPFHTYAIKEEHLNTICAITKGNGVNTFLSASWDNTAKYWCLSTSTSKPVQTFTGHTAAVWHVRQISDGRVLTASADKTIGVWSPEGQKLSTLSGHAEAVRCLEDFPELKYFMSVSNDASIKIWNYDCENINTLYGHNNFIYSMYRCRPHGMDSFVTSDEDRTVKFWQNNEDRCTIELPAQSIWAVACLSNGDIVTGSSDGIIRIFTLDESRVVDETNLLKFTEEVNALKKQALQEIGGVKVSDLPGTEALYEPGKRNGQMKMIRDGNSVFAYTWIEDGENSRWDKVGDVLGGKDKDETGKTMYKGQYYDFVFSVDVEDGKPPLKLPFNRGDDPYQCAHKFLAKHMLPAEYLEQVVDFILKNSNEQYVPSVSTEYQDPFTGGSRYTPNYGANNQGQTGVNLDPFTGGSSYSTSGSRLQQTAGRSTASNSESKSNFFPVKSYHSFDVGDSKVILRKLKEFNEKCGDGDKLQDTDLEQVVDLCCNPPTDGNTVDILFKLLEWPDDIIFPVLDVIRLAVRNKVNNELISTVNNGVIFEKIKSYTNSDCKIINNMIIALRTMTNLCLHETGEDLVFNNRFDILENFTSLNNLNKNCQIALATTLLNLTILVVKRNDEIGITVLAQVIPDLVTKLTESEAHFRAYVALGTLITRANVYKLMVKAKVQENSNFISTLHLHSFSSQTDIENKRMNCVKELLNIL
ncbi:phospholipase A-2-activating protein [Diorhabda sublineata]|uniref:phospholipase A-2-activating protein n=1 Tax=Diorhabda sublineata TaxID=1163346 RepID=UPI0024E12421|nr:phospholipase A-2-activating protein [Diorhabda sublineata]